MAINGVTPSAAESLNYSTVGNVDATIAKTVTGLNIPAGGEFAITWTSARGGSGGSSKQIGLANVVVSSMNSPQGYSSWNQANAGGQTADLDFDGDGLDNGVEYFMGTAGNAFSASPAVVSGVVTYPRSAGAVVNSFKVEVSSNLTTWENATVNYSANLSVTSNQVSFTLPTGPTKLFVRLSVEP